MYNNQFRTDALNRIKIAQGHLQKVRDMIENDEYCPNIILQSSAVQAALKNIDELILHGHLHSCVLKDLHGSKKENEKMVDEIIELFKKS